MRKLIILACLPVLYFNIGEENFANFRRKLKINQSFLLCKEARLIWQGVKERIKEILERND